MSRRDLTVPGGPTDPALDAYLHSEADKLKALAVKNGRRFGKRNLPEACGDSLVPYTGEITSGFQRLVAEIERRHEAQAALHDARVDAALYKEKGAAMDRRIDTLETENNDDRCELDDIEVPATPSKTWLWCAGVVIGASEIALNAKAFQVLGENLLMAASMSLGVSVAILIGAYGAAHCFKKAKTAWERRLVLLITAPAALVVFAGLGAMRSTYLALHGVPVSPVFFVAINLFLFAASALLSYLSISDPKDDAMRKRRSELLQSIDAGTKTLAQLHADKEELPERIAANLKSHHRLDERMKLYAEECRRLEREAIAAFLRTNRLYRKDRLTPDCFRSPTVADSADPLNNIPI